MGKIIAFTNQKGGVGKTTTCVNMCAALRLGKKKVLLVDSDPQGNATSGMGISKSQRPNIYDVLVRESPVKTAVVGTKYGDVLPANRDLAGAAIELMNVKEREFVLKKALEEIRGEYDYIFIDCPPSLELLTLNALVAADGIIVPVQCEYYALEGIADLVATVELAKKRVNPKLGIEGIVLTMYDSRTNFSDQVTAEIKSHFGNKVFKTFIPRNVRLAEAPSHGKPGIEYDRWSKGSRAYQRLAGEFLKRQE